MMHKQTRAGNLTLRPVRFPMNNTIEPLSVLIVDDNPDAANSLAELLTLHGHAALIAYRGRDALRLAEANPPDVVILDLLMPGMDGWEVARRLRTLNPPPLVAALSGCTAATCRSLSCAAGIPYHFVKPVDPAVILTLLAGAARSRAAPGVPAGNIV